jgi:Tfp pilus assembly protein PilW
MLRRSLPHNPETRRGFSVIEALVSVLILVIVMTAAVSLLFGLRSFAEKQQSFTAPRQTARSAMDYVSYWVQGAGDMNILLNNPSALVMYYLGDAITGTPVKRAAYNNLTAAQATLGDLGTDIITLAFPTNPVKLAVASPVPLTLGAGGASITIRFNYSAGCATDNNANIAAFKQDAGYGSGTQSPLSTLIDAQGNYCYVKLLANPTSDCTQIAFSPFNVISVTANPAMTGQIDPNGGHVAALQGQVHLLGGVTYVSFRVLNTTLQQKNGMFDPAVDGTNASTFFPIAENVEDFQVAYIYGLGAQAGQVYNTSVQTIPAGTNPDGVPTQAGRVPPGVPGPFDIINVVGVRLTITARSLPLRLSGLKLTALTAKAPTSGPQYDPTVYYHYRPSAEDHPWDGTTVDYATPTSPVYQHYRLTTTLMLRNRMLGG